MFLDPQDLSSLTHPADEGPLDGVIVSAPIERRISILLAQSKILQSFIMPPTLFGCIRLPSRNQKEVRSILHEKIGFSVEPTTQLVQEILSEVKSECQKLLMLRPVVGAKDTPSEKKHGIKISISKDRQLKRARFEPEKDEEEHDPSSIEKLDVDDEQKSEEALTLPSVRGLIDDFSCRPMASFEIAVGVANPRHVSILALKATSKQRSDDEVRFLHILEAHNEQFREQLPSDNPEEVAGVVKKLLVSDGTPIFVRADLHSDLSTLLAQLQMLRDEEYLDEDYRCRSSFRMIFLGDYADRGGNDVEVLSLLLKLRMENASAVFLIRGNHEEIAMHREFSASARFFEQHHDAVVRCYRSFPIALCVASQTKYQKKDGTFQRQFIHFSHGLFTPSVNLGPFLEDDLQERFEVSKKMRFFESASLVSTKARKALEKLQKEFGEEEAEQALRGSGYRWNDVGEYTEFVLRRGLKLSLAAIHNYTRATARSGAKIVAIARGHQHRQQEELVDKKNHFSRKVLVMTLPVAVAGNFFAKMDEFRGQHAQGMMLTVAPKGGQWKKRAAIVDVDERTKMPISTLAEASSELQEPLRL